MLVSVFVALHLFVLGCLDLGFFPFSSLSVLSFGAARETATPSSLQAQCYFLSSSFTSALIMNIARLPIANMHR